VNTDPVEVISLALSGAGTCGPTLQAAIDFATARGTAVVVAAGNDGGEAAKAAPASCANTIVVGAVDATHQRAAYSNGGATVDLVAPGADAQGVGYQGTSAAAAHVAGVAALVQSAKPRSPAELERLLKATAHWLDCGSDCGAGLVDADAAVQSATTLHILISGPQTVSEGTGGVTPVTYTVSLSEAFNEPVSFSYEFSTDVDGWLGLDTGATPGVDFVHGDWGIQTFAPGETSRQLVVGIVGDARTEFSEKFALTVATVGNNVTYSYASVPVTIDDDNDVDVLANAELVPMSGDPVVDGEMQYFRIQVPAGRPHLFVRSNLEVPLYVRQGSLPSSADLLCPVDDLRAGRHCDIANPAAGTWYAALAGGSTGRTVMAEYGPTGLSVRDARLAEHDTGTRVMTFTVDMPTSLPNAVTFDLATANGSAAAGTDYVATSTTGVVLPAGMRSKTYSVVVKGDAVDEGDETFALNLTNAVGAAITDGQGIGTIVDDDGASGLRIADAAVDEGGALVFVASLAAPQASPVAFEVAVSDGTAAGGPLPTWPNQVTGDYVQRLVATGFIPAGQLATTLVVDTQEELEIEDDETVLVDITAAYGATASDRHAVGTIRNDDHRTVNLVASSIVEGDSGSKVALVTAQLSHSAEGDVTFFAATDNTGTAAAGTDFVALPPTQFTIPFGQASTTIPITIKGDTQVEQDETVHVVVSDAVGAVAGAGSDVTILSDEKPGASISDASVVEGNAGQKVMTFTVSLSQPMPGPVRYWFQTCEAGGLPEAAAGEDFQYANSGGPHTIPAGQTSATETVVIFGDTLGEGDEYLGACMTTGGWDAETLDGQGIGTIVEDDPVPTLSVADVAVGEGDSGTKQMTFTARLSAPNNLPVTFHWSVANGSATVGSDFDEPFEPFGYIPAGQVAGTFSVAIRGDTVEEGTESFTVNLSDVRAASAPDLQVLGTIVDNDGPAPTLSVNDAAVAEGNSGTKGLRFTVSLSEASAVPVTFSIATANGTALAGPDYVARTATTQTISVGALAKTFDVVVNGDTAIEANETLKVNLAAPTGATILDGQGTGTITNDDGPTVSIGDAAILEGNAGTKVLRFTVSLSKASTGPVTFNVATANGTATAGSDYVARSLANQSIPAGTLAKVFDVTLNGDTTIEPTETLLVNVSNVVGGVLGDGQATGTITNDDGPTLSIADVATVEGASGTKVLRFTVSLSQAAAGPVTYGIATANGTALAGSDYVARSLANQSIPAGTLTRVFDVTLNGDTAIEPNETFAVNLTASTGASILDGQATGTITNDDGPTVSIADVATLEGNAGTKVLRFTVSLSQASAGPVTYDIATANGTATAGSDYVARSLVNQSIAAGTLAKVFDVTLNGDTAVEANETLLVNLGNFAGGVLGDGQATGTISNDD
jgi:hypothetical protein